MKNSFLPVLAFVLISFCSCNNQPDTIKVAFPWKVDSTTSDVAKYVNPMIGTDGHGHTFPGATAPFGMVQLSPDTRIDGSWDGCSGYHYSDSIIYGFSHTHLSGTGCSDYGDIMLMPGVGEPIYTAGTDSTEGYRCGFSHDAEAASAGYYSVTLDNGVDCKLTASPRVGVHRYTFPKNEKSWIILDMAHRDEVLDCEIEIVNDHTIRGKRFSKAWAQNQELWFYAEFSKPFKYSFWSHGTISDADSTAAKDAKGMFQFETTDDDRTVEVKVALSPVSCENAKLNMETETGGMNFGQVHDKTLADWNAELGKIEVSSSHEEKLETFYTALYHCFIAPNVYCDVNGDYRGMDMKVYNDTIHQRYTVFSLWDTYRALHPLFTIVQQKRTNDFINTFLEQYKESGRLPVWELSSNETDCMIGYHSVSVITDAWMKGITGFDTALAYEAMKASAMENRSGLPQYRKCGFIPAEGEGESVSKTLEYAYDDWCISRCAARMHDKNGIADFQHRAKAWRNLYNPETGFLQARVNNSFISPFNPSEVNFHYTEANAWQYSLAVQQDPQGLMQLHGPAEFRKHLDNLFSASTETSGRDQADISGMIGQYAQGNEPSHHMAYLYTLINEDWKTQKLVHQICNTLYTNKPDGLCGNEDCGQMSAWYVLSASGFYPISPGKPEYTIGSPQFDTARFHLENGKTFTIVSDSADEDKPYVWFYQKNVLEGQNMGHTLPYSMIIAGSIVHLDKHANPEPPVEFDCIDYGPNPLSVPWITGVSSRTFVDRVTLQMKSLNPADKIYYSLNNGAFQLYTSPVTLTEHAVVRMYSEGEKYGVNDPNIYNKPDYSPYAEIGKAYSDTAIAEFFKAPAWKSISIRYAFAPQYTAGGERGLIDGLKGTTNFRTGLWQGYEGVDMDVIIDMGKSMNVDSVNMNFLSDHGAWIFEPTKIVVIVTNDTTQSMDGTATNSQYILGNGRNDSPAEIIHVGMNGGTGRYVHVLASSIKKCPKGHPGEGQKAWVFCDEISIIPK